MLTECGLPSPQGTAVIIEDDLDIRNLMCAVLRQAGFDAHPAATGLQGVELVRSTNAMIVTLDIGLPDIDGYEVLRRIRDFSDCHVIAVTARTAHSDISTALQFGADDYLGKPFRPRELSARINSVPERVPNGSADTTPRNFSGSISAGPVVRRPGRPLTEAHHLPAFRPATVTSRIHATSMNGV